MDAVIKHLSGTEHTLTVILGRYVFTFLFAAMIWLSANRPKITMDMWRAHFGRGIVMAICSSSFIYALSVLPLAKAITLFFVAPLIIPFLASILLGEKLTLNSVIAVVVAFLGACVALSGGAGSAAKGANTEYWLGVAAVLVAAVTYALSAVLLRERAEKDGSAIVGLLGALIPLVLVSLPALAFGSVPQPSSLPAFALMGILGAASLWCLTEAYRCSEAQKLAPLEYTALLWAAIFGFVFFNEAPQPRLWAGAVIIIAACLWHLQKTSKPKAV
jgi:S-adenosylmethionine uptake transporter